MNSVFDWQRPPTIGTPAPKPSRAKPRTIAEQRARILRDNALAFNVTLATEADAIRNATISGRHFSLGL